MNNESNKEILQLNLDDIIPNRFQPREVFDEQELKELALSIKEHGVIQPIIVRSVNGKYEIIAGERRYKASALAGKTTIPAIINNLDDKEASKVALLENLQRKNLNPIEEARTFQKILELDEMTQEELAKTMGKSQSAVANKLRLLQLPDPIQDAILKKQIPEHHARLLLKVEDPKKQKELFKQIVTEKLSVKEVDRRIKEMYPDSKEKEDVSNINTYLNNAPLNPTMKIETPNSNYGKIKILDDEEDDDSSDGTPKFLNYGDVKKDDDDVKDVVGGQNFLQPTMPVDINKIRDNATDINTPDKDSNGSSLDNFLNINSGKPTIPSIENNEFGNNSKFLTPAEAIVKTSEEDTISDSKIEDYFKSNDLMGINLPNEINTNNKADTSIKDVVASMKQEEHDMTITEAKNEIRELVEKLKLKGIKISCDEMDFEKATQFMIKIDKE
ncbi:MAG: ParB/RepB/Spo0J family partition protein [Bacilli bacterium]|nr:ParB/RepB/Spo0J family partition protein [Bacilli bacterium]